MKIESLVLVTGIFNVLPLVHDTCGSRIFSKMEVEKEGGRAFNFGKLHVSSRRKRVYTQKSNTITNYIQCSPLS